MSPMGILRMLKENVLKDMLELQLLFTWTKILSQMNVKPVMLMIYLKWVVNTSFVRTELNFLVNPLALNVGNQVQHQVVVSTLVVHRHNHLLEALHLVQDPLCGLLRALVLPQVLHHQRCQVLVPVLFLALHQVLHLLVDQV